MKGGAAAKDRPRNDGYDFVRLLPVVPVVPVLPVDPVVPLVPAPAAALAVLVGALVSVDPVVPVDPIDPVDPVDSVVPVDPVVPVVPVLLLYPDPVPVLLYDCEPLCLTRSRFSTCVTPVTDSAISSARRLSMRLFTVPVKVTSAFCTDTSNSEASM